MGHSYSLGAYTCAQRINVGICRIHGYLAAGASLAGNGFYLHDALLYLRHLYLKQSLYQHGMGTRHRYLRPLERAAHIHHIHLYALIELIFFARYLLLGRKHALGFAQLYIYKIVFYSVHKGSKQLVLLVCIFAVYLPLLRLTQTLRYYLPRRLCAYTPEILGGILYLDAVAYLIAGIYLLCLLKGQLGIQIVEPLHYGLYEEYLHISRFAVHSGDYFPVIAFRLFIGGNHSQLY